jgi:hypothetical protein
MLMSDKIDLLSAALSRFHAECPKITKDTRNDYFKSKYADLGTILGIVNPILAKCGLSVVQMPTGENVLVTMLLHESGQFIRDESVMRPIETVIRRDANKNDILGVTPQALGSAITYQRRYAVAAILSLCIDDDDDGNAASANGRKPNDRNEPANQSNDRSNPEPPKTEPKPETPPKVDPLSETQISDILSKINAASEGELPKMEQALTRHGIQGSIKKDDWALLAASLLFRWYNVATTPKTLGEIANKVVAYRGKGLVSDESFEVLKKAFADRTNELKG